MQNNNISKELCERMFKDIIQYRIIDSSNLNKIISNVKLMGQMNQSNEEIKPEVNYKFDHILKNTFGPAILNKESPLLYPILIKYRYSSIEDITKVVSSKEFYDYAFDRLFNKNYCQNKDLNRSMLELLEFIINNSGVIDSITDILKALDNITSRALMIKAITPPQSNKIPNNQNTIFDRDAYYNKNYSDTMNKPPVFKHPLDNENVPDQFLRNLKFCKCNTSNNDYDQENAFISLLATKRNKIETILYKNIDSFPFYLNKFLSSISTINTKNNDDIIKVLIKSSLEIVEKYNSILSLIINSLENLKDNQTPNL